MAEVSEADLPKLLENLSPTAMYALAEPSTPTRRGKRWSIGLFGARSYHLRNSRRSLTGIVLGTRSSAVLKLWSRSLISSPRRRSHQHPSPVQSISPYARPASDKPSLVTITPDMVDPVLRVRGLLEQALRVVEADGAFQASIRARLVDLIDAVKAEGATRPIRLPLQRR